MQPNHPSDLIEERPRQERSYMGGQNHVVKDIAEGWVGLQGALRCGYITM